MSGGNKGNAGFVFNAWAACVTANLPTQRGMGCLIAKTQQGIYTVTLSAQLEMAAQNYALVLHCSQTAGNANVFYSVADTSNTVKTVAFVDAAAAAQDPVSFTVGLVYLLT